MIKKLHSVITAIPKINSLILYTIIKEKQNICGIGRVHTIRKNIVYIEEIFTSTAKIQGVQMILAEDLIQKNFRFRELNGIPNIQDEMTLSIDIDNPPEWIQKYLKDNYY